jgi:molecular chaperone GrpE
MKKKTQRKSEKKSKLRKEFEEVKARAEEYKGLVQHVQADFENYRKRVERDFDERQKYANQAIVGELLDVRDNLERALENKGGMEGLVEGVELTLKQLDSLLEKHGVLELNPVGVKFDPNFHEALLAEEGDVDEETVVEVLQKGYLLHSRVIRPAKVKIIKPKGG